MSVCTACHTENHDHLRFCMSCGGKLSPPPRPAGPLSLAVELMVQCGACWQPVPVNALVTHVTCSKCKHAVEVTLELWQNLLGIALGRVGGMAPGDSKSATALGGGGRQTLTYTRAEPACAGCQAVLALPAALAQARSTNGWAGCAGCGRWLAVRTPPELGAVAPGAALTIGEDVAQLPGSPGGLAVPNAAKPVAFPCPSCAGSLRVDGTSRVVSCQFCTTTAYLPDDLWQVLHPAATALRWYVVF